MVPVAQNEALAVWEAADVALSVGLGGAVALSVPLLVPQELGVGEGLLSWLDLLLAVDSAEVLPVALGKALGETEAVKALAVDE